MSTNRGMLIMNGIDIFIMIIGYVGAVGIAIFSFPEVYNVLKNKKTSHLNKTSVSLFTLLFFSSLCFAVSGFYNFSKDLGLNEGQMTTGLAFSLAVSIANVFSCLAPSIILTFKLVRSRIAKNNNITELELEQRSKK
ncbi:MAG: hypothetical protein HDR31_01245 [Mycoplasma sp.]|nr:hypothetical protein [Mycoplasma sp.]